MTVPKRLFGGLVLALALVVAGQAQSATISEKAALQAAMQRHIDRNLVEGVFLHLDRDAGEVRSLYPSKAHSIILSMGDYFILCSDFRDRDGQNVNVDFYLARAGDGYVVFHAAVDDRVALQQWLREGKAERVD